MSPLVQDLSDHWIEYACGAVFITCYAHARFNTPPTQKYSTTRGQYYVAFVMYAAVLVGGFLFFSYSPALFGVTRLAGVKAVENLSPPLVVALFLTVMLPQIPVLRDIDSNLRAYFWRQASIPSEVNRLLSRLAGSTFTVPDRARARVAEALRASGIADHWIVFDHEGFRICPWVKTTVLMQVVEDWRRERRYQAYMQIIAGEFQALAAEHEDYLVEVAEYTRSTEAPPQPPGTFGPEHNRLTKRANVLLKRLYLVIAQGILHCEPHADARTRRLRETGFDATYENQPPPLEVLVIVFLGMLMLFFVCFALMPMFLSVSHQTDRTLLERLAAAVRIAIIYCISIGCVIFLRKWWAIDDPLHRIHRRVACYLWAGMLAVAISAGFSIVAYRMEHDTWAAASWRFNGNWPYLLVSFIVTVLTGAQLDDEPSRWRWSLTRRHPRLFEGLLLGGASTVTAAFVWVLLQQVNATPRHGLTPRQPPPIEVLVFVIGLAGFAIGALIPDWYRQARGRGGVPAHADPVLPLQPATGGGAQA